MNGKALFISALGVGVLFLVFQIIDRWVTPWVAKRSVKKMLRDIKDGKPQKPRDYDFEITFDPTNISVQSLKGKTQESISVAWAKINRATAFKRDLFSVDCICLLFETADGVTLEINEDMKGWPELTDVISNHLPGCKPLSDWIFEVATPAFATNPTEIFARV